MLRHNSGLNWDMMTEVNCRHGKMNATRENIGGTNRLAAVTANEPHNSVKYGLRLGRNQKHLFSGNFYK